DCPARPPAGLGNSARRLFLCKSRPRPTEGGRARHHFAFVALATAVALGLIPSACDSGSSSGTGGSSGRGGSAAGGSSGSGGAGTSCQNVTACGGDVTGTWTVMSSCLAVSGNLDISLLNAGCASAPATGL